MIQGLLFLRKQSKKTPRENQLPRVRLAYIKRIKKERYNAKGRKKEI